MALYKTEKWKWVITAKAQYERKGQADEWNLPIVHCLKWADLKSIKKGFYKSLERWRKGWACEWKRKTENRWHRYLN